MVWAQSSLSVYFLSTGDDSKTLMLVHISPKEDDLCETICSLNFATRVRKIHLGMTDSTVSKLEHYVFFLFSLTSPRR